MRSVILSTVFSVMVAVAVTALLLGTPPACAQWGWTSSHSTTGKVSEEREVTLPHVAGKALTVETKNGSIRIVKADRKDIKITANVTAASQDRLDEIKVVIERASKDDGSGLSVVAHYGELNKTQKHDSISMVIEIPDARGVTATSSNGRIHIAGLDGEAVLRSSNGAIVADEHNGVVRAATSNGSITVNGAIGLVSVTTSNGSVKVTDATGDVKVRTSNGSINVAQAPGNSGVLDLTSSNGSVKVAVADSISGELAASTSNGRVTIEKDIAAQIDQPRRQNAVVHFDDADIRHVVRTSNASVTISHAG